MLTFTGSFTNETLTKSMAKDIKETKPKKSKSKPKKSKSKRPVTAIYRRVDPPESAKAYNNSMLPVKSPKKHQIRLSFK